MQVEECQADGDGGLLLALALDDRALLCVRQGLLRHVSVRGSTMQPLPGER